MNKFTEPLKQYLKKHECLFDFDRRKGALHFGIDGTNARWRCMACGDDASRFVLVSLIPLVAPEQRRSACAELLTRINVRLGLGHFDLDFSDGELRFLTSVPLGEKGELHADIIEHLIGGHHTIVDSFIPAISAVLFAAMPPDKAIEIDPQKESEPSIPRFSLN
jgi:hypothetical protein